MAKIFDYDVFVGTRKELIHVILEHIQNSKLMTILSMNTLKLHLGKTDPKYKKLFHSFTHITQDGQSIVFAPAAGEWYQIRSDIRSGAYG